MRIETITYKRVKNLGNYQTEILEATAHLDEDENYAYAIQGLKAFVNDQLGIEQPKKDDDDEIANGF